MDRADMDSKMVQKKVERQAYRRKAQGMQNIMAKHEALYISPKAT